MSDFLIYALIGFVAQLGGTTLGMGFSTISSGILLALGFSPVIASAAVNGASIFSSINGGVTHWCAGNVEKRSFVLLSVFGALGAIAGALLAINIGRLVPKPFFGFYLVVLAALIVTKAVSPLIESNSPRSWHLAALGILGGLLSGVSGGGWGPVVTGHLIANGYSPRLAIGVSNAAKFFSALTATAVFLTITKSVRVDVICGLMLGCLLAAPVAALACKKLSPRILMIAVSTLLAGLGCCAASVDSAQWQGHEPKRVTFSLPLIGLRK